MGHYVLGHAINGILFSSALMFLSLYCGTVELRRPRVRGLEARFESRILPLFVRRCEEVGALLPELYATLESVACGLPVWSSGTGTSGFGGR